MGYSQSVYQAAYRELARRRAQAQQEADRRRNLLYEAQPRAQQIACELGRTGAAAGRAVVRGGDVRAALEQLHRQNRALQQELDQILAQYRMSRDDLEPHYRCPLCGDRGSVDGRMCACMKALLQEEALRQLNADAPLADCSFETFDLALYPDQPDASGHSPQLVMQRTLRYCRRYAETFSPQAKSLLMSGKTGLGKTHLSLAIAKVVIERGYGVVYNSAGNLLSRLEDTHFGRSGEDILPLLLQCDLLILDDLGTEFRSNFSTACLYNIVNSRQLSKRPIIINTNLTTKEMTSYYTERFTSRVIGGFIDLPFIGNDVRQLKRMRGGS